MRALRCCLAFSTFVFGWGLVRADEKQEEIDLVAVRANPVLREALSLSSPYPDAPPGNVEERYREEWIDNRIDYFVKQLYVKLGAIKATVKDAEAARYAVVAFKGDGAEKELEGWREALRKTEDQSKTLRSDLANILTDLRCKEKFELKMAPTAEADRFGAEMQLLSDQVSQVERFIRDYFVKPTHVTSVSDLKEANILDYLKRVEKIASTVRGRL